METMDKKPLCIATRNPNKCHEMTPVLSPFWEVKCSANYPEMDALDDIAETGDTFQANAEIKAVATSMRMRLSVGRPPSLRISGSSTSTHALTFTSCENGAWT